MSLELLYVIGTVSSWVTWIALFRGLYLVVRRLLNPRGVDLAGNRAGLWACAVLAAVGMVASFTIPMNAERALGQGWKIPLVWFVMPFFAWLAVFCAIGIAARLIQAWMSHELSLRRNRIKNALWWMVAGIAAYWLFKRSGDSIGLLRGAITLSPSAALGLLFLAVLILFALALSERSTYAQRSGVKSVLTHSALIAGSVIFGMPFAWLLVTSFKEDKDIAGGIDWVPKVSETVPYFDPKEPMLEGVLDGARVQGPLVETMPDGKLRIDVFKPASMRGMTLIDSRSNLKEVPKQIPIVHSIFEGKKVIGRVVEELDGGRRRIEISEPIQMRGIKFVALPQDVEPVRHIGLDWSNYPGSLEFLPPEAKLGLVYLRNTLILVVLSVIGTVLSSAIVAYAFSRMKFPGRNMLFTILLSTMMLPAAVTLLPNFLIFRSLGWIDTLYPLWVPTFFAGAFNVFLLNQFFKTIPMELEDAAKIDGCSYWRTFWQVMMPQIKPALAVIAIWTFMGAWNNFMGPLIFISSPENMPVAYALQLFQSERGGEAGLMMAFATMSMIPVLLLFFFAQRYFIEGVTLSGLGGR